ncbi:MAG: Cys-tRNA(Pro) deacylase [Acidimicrobiia bacterium]|nr:Cys-tRNA(Pro) deacylase [Acidimicrobiia bacterium]
MTKTNALRLIEQAGIDHEVREYELAIEEFTAERVAELVAMEPEQVYKTLVAVGDHNGPCFAVIPANTELDLKALAAAHGERKIRLASLKEVMPLTGYERGSVTAIGAKKPFPVYLDEIAELFDMIAISAGAKGIQVVLKPEDYISFTGASVVAIGR